MSNATTSWPASSVRSTTIRPIRPSPMTPSCMSGRSRSGEVGVVVFGSRPPPVAAVLRNVRRDGSFSFDAPRSLSDLSVMVLVSRSSVDAGPVRRRLVRRPHEKSRLANTSYHLINSGDGADSAPPPNFQMPWRPSTGRRGSRTRSGSENLYERAPRFGHGPDDVGSTIARLAVAVLFTAIPAPDQA